MAKAGVTWFLSSKRCPVALVTESYVRAYKIAKNNKIGTNVKFIIQYERNGRLKNTAYVIRARWKKPWYALSR